MQNKRNKKRLSLILGTMLIVAMALGTTACSDNNLNKNSEINSQVENSTESPSQSETNLPSESNTEETMESEVISSESNADVTILGEGSTIFDFRVVDGEGNESVFEIHTDKTTVGDALLELELIAGEVSTYGLYVKTVNGITADYDTDGTYWGFYVNGEYAMSGVDTTTITEGDSYSFKVSK